MMKLNPLRRSEPARLTRAEGWDALRSVEREMASMMDHMGMVTGRWPAEVHPEGQSPSAWEPRVDILEDDQEYLVKAELPEVKREAIKVELHDHTLSISGERKNETEEKGKKYHRIERTYGSFERDFLLPDDTDTARVTSEFQDGMLKIHLPKVPGAPPKSIEVK